MSIKEFVEYIKSRHFSLVAEGESLSLKANRKKLKSEEIDAVRQDKEIISFIKANKPALIAYLREAPAQKRTDDVSALYRLSGLQEGMLFYGLYDTGTGAYINQFACDLVSPDLEAFEKSWQYAINNHSILRSSFYYDSFNVPVQCVYRYVQLPVNHFDYGEMDAAAQDAAIRAFEEEDRRRGFDFKKAPVMRLALIRLSDRRYRMVWTHHHILLDGWSVPILMEEVLLAYEQLTAGRELLPVPEDRYEDYIRYLESRNKEADEAFWRSYLKDTEEACLLPFVETTADRTRGLGAYATEKFPAGAGVTARIEAYAQRQHITVNTLMQGIWALLLHRYTGRDGVTFGVTVSGRPEELPAVERRVGMFINTLPVHTSCEAGQHIASWLQQLQQEQQQCREHQYTTLNDIQHWSGIQGDLFDTILVFENYPVSEAAAAAGSALQLENVFFHEQTNYPLDIMVETGKEITVSFNYNTALLQEYYAKQICRHFEHVLLQVIDGAAQQLQDITVITAAEKRILVEDFNNTARAYDLSTTFYNAVEKFAVATPQKTAIICNDKCLTYQQLNDRVNMMAAGISNRVSIGEDDFVAVFMDRSENMAAAILALWKLGGAYVPIEKKLPDNRIISILQDAGVKAVIAERNLVSPAMAEKIQHLCTLIYTDELMNGAAAANPGRPFNPHSLSFSVFTSGSTGSPKGAMSEHIGMMNHALATIDYLEMDHNSVLVQNASHSFDISVWQFFTAFIKGGTTLIYDDDVVNNSEEFLRRLMVHKVTVLQVVPTYLNLLLDVLEKELERYPLPVKSLVCGGEILKPETVKRWFALYPDTTMVNDYGPAEASDGTCWYVFNHLPDGMEKIPVGTSIYNMHTYIVDGSMNLCPVGVVGELCVAGVGVGRGYIGDPEKTAAAFTTDPFLPEKNQRLYKTGDLARYLPDGLLEFHGRKDYQVKVNGQRIELGEIEAKLVQLPGVKDAAVIAADDTNGRKYLSAFVVFHEAQAVAFNAIKEQLSGELPPYMVPRQFQELNALPVNANGKVDRKLLARMSAAIVVENDFVAAEQEVEKILVAAWQLVLKKDKIGVTDNFYECGGDSISAIQVASQVYRHGYKVEIKDIMKLPTIRELCGVLKPLKVTAEQGVVTGYVPLTPIQADFFAMEKAVPHHYNQSVMLQAARPVNETAMRAALLELSNFHDVLRTIFTEDNGKMLQYIRPAGIEVPLTVSDWRNAPNATSLMEEMANQLQAGLNLASGPLMKAAIFRLPEGDHLFLTIHHLLVDAVSWRILLEDLFSLYTQQLTQQQVTLPAKTDAFLLWSERLAQYAESSEFKQEIDYWQRMHAVGAANIQMDGDSLNAPSVKDIREYSVRLDEDVTMQLTRQAHTAFNTDINDLLLAALGLATAWVFDLQQLQLMLEGHGRPDILKDISVARTVGWFTAEYPVCLDLQQVNDLPLHIKETKELLHKVPHNGIGYGLAKYSTTNSTLRHMHKPQLVFNYLGATGDDLPEGEFRLLEHAPGAVESPLNKSDYSLELIGFLRENQLVLTIYYSAVQFREETIIRWMEAYKEALEKVTALCTGSTIIEYTPSDYDYKELSLEELNQLNSLFE